MTLVIKCVVSGRVNGQEALHLALPAPDKLMRVLRPVVGSEPLIMLGRQAQASERGTVGSEFFGHDLAWRETLALQELSHQLHSCFGIASGLDQQVENFAFVVYGPP